MSTIFSDYLNSRFFGFILIMESEDSVTTKELIQKELIKIINLQSQIQENLDEIINLTKPSGSLDSALSEGVKSTLCIDSIKTKISNEVLSGYQKLWKNLHMETLRQDTFDDTHLPLNDTTDIPDQIQ